VASEDAATERFMEFADAWANKSPATREAVRARGHLTNEHAAPKCVYWASTSLDPTGAGRRRWTMHWRAPLNAFQIAIEGRLTPANH
jgi:putative transposase